MKKDFQKQQTNVLWKLNADSNNENTKSTPDEDESREFWTKIWVFNKVVNKDDELLSHIKYELLDLDCEGRYNNI